jgi:hypothetical protein
LKLHHLHTSGLRQEISEKKVNTLPGEEHPDYGNVCYQFIEGITTKETLWNNTKQRKGKVQNNKLHYIGNVGYPLSKE